MLISKELLNQIKKLQITTDLMASEILSGEYKSAFKGKGINFEKLREYQFGDDIRLIDWKVTARNDRPFVREYKEERQLNIVLIVDLSASTNFGTNKHSKQSMATELASLLSALAIKNNDKVGLILATDKIESFIPVKQGRSHVFRIIKELLSYKPKSPQTNLEAVLKSSMNLIPSHSIVFLISDFLGNNINSDLSYLRQAKLIRKAHDLIAVSIRDPKEYQLPNLGLLEIMNPETGEMSILNLNRQSLRNQFCEDQRQEQESLKQAFQSIGVDFLELSTGKPYIHDLLHLFSVIRRNR